MDFSFSDTTSDDIYEKPFEVSTSNTAKKLAEPTSLLDELLIEEFSQRNSSQLVKKASLHGYNGNRDSITSKDMYTRKMSLDKESINLAENILESQKTNSNQKVDNIKDLYKDMEYLEKLNLNESECTESLSECKELSDLKESSINLENLSIDSENLGDASEFIEEEEKNDNDLPIELRNCVSCKGKIGYEPYCMTDHGVFHYDHFKCFECLVTLINEPFYQYQRKVYCSNDFAKLFSKPCDYCQESISQSIIKFEDKFFHVEHFFCEDCNALIGDGPYYIFLNKPICMDCFGEKHAKPCKKCSKLINSQVVNVFNFNYHADCFTCEVCQCKLEDGSFHLLENKLYCLTHFHQQNQTRCDNCLKVILDKFIVAGGFFYHPDHFRCNYCKILLEGLPYRMKNLKPYCLKCYT